MFNNNPNPPSMSSPPSPSSSPRGFPHILPLPTPSNPHFTSMSSSPLVLRSMFGSRKKEVDSSALNENNANTVKSNDEEDDSDSTAEISPLRRRLYSEKLDTLPPLHQLSEDHQPDFEQLQLHFPRISSKVGDEEEDFRGVYSEEEDHPTKPLFGSSTTSTSTPPFHLADNKQRTYTSPPLPYYQKQSPNHHPAPTSSSSSYQFLHPSYSTSSFSSGNEDSLSTSSAISRFQSNQHIYHPNAPPPATTAHPHPIHYSRSPSPYKSDGSQSTDPAYQQPPPSYPSPYFHPHHHHHNQTPYIKSASPISMANQRHTFPPHTYPHPSISVPPDQHNKRAEPNKNHSDPNEKGMFCQLSRCMLCMRGPPASLVRTPTWATIMRIALYCLKNELNQEKEYFSLKSDIYNFVMIHWDHLCINKKNIDNNWHKQIQDVLSHTKDLFESGMDVFQQSGYWRLKSNEDPWTLQRRYFTRNRKPSQKKASTPKNNDHGNLNNNNNNTDINNSTDTNTDSNDNDYSNDNDLFYRNGIEHQQNKAKSKNNTSEVTTATDTQSTSDDASPPLPVDSSDSDFEVGDDLEQKKRKKYRVKKQSK
eukprot:TRINITY_DN6532_c0_g2_i2.p1 TRINITY_DN6532_c0_g2~~TRINITY_DN6532_c0_g2_i2.p1  ORF type:complete len:589 (+),score=123.44 TRINITY_DN6532_c0_g2_i2:247-2013(+)